MEHIGLQISQFADTALIPRPTLSQILSGRNKKISNEVLEKLHRAYPALNISWLLFGDEPMETTSSSTAGSMPTMQAYENTKLQINHEGRLNDEAEPVFADASSASIANGPIALVPDSSKRVQTIMVFYSDNSFETFTPAQR